MSRLTALLAVLLCVALTSPAAASSTITGKLNRSGYSVIALSRDGKAASAKTKRGVFRVRAPGRTVTIQLRDPHGRYAGPIVVSARHGKVVLGIRRGANLGRVLVRHGYAKTAHRLNRRWINTKVVATAKHGGPIGGATFGLVPGTAKLAQANPGGIPDQTGQQNPGADTDSDGVPDAFDVDANGNGVLDNVDTTAPAPGFGVFSQMFLTIDQTVNADASAVTTADIDAAMKAHLGLVFTAVADDTELDCTGLSYCAPGGTGEQQTGVNGTQPFPSCCDADGDGFGTISGGGPPGPTGSEFRLNPNAGSADIGSGDTLIERVGGTQEVPGGLNFVFTTIPALHQWASPVGAAANTVSYPVASGGPGTQANPLPIVKDANGHYTLTMTLWRPQRRAIAGAREGSGAVDIGGLAYDVNIPNGGSAQPPPPGTPNSSPQCDPGSLSTSDPNLSVISEGGRGEIGRLLDKAPDTPSSADNTITFSVDLTKCVADKGVTTLNPGTTLNMDLGANSESVHSVDHANQIVYIRTQ